MAAISTEKSYRIKHLPDIGNWSASDLNPSTMTEIPFYPTRISSSSNLISKSWNSILGDFRDIPIAEKMKVIWTFEGASANIARQIFKTMILDEIYGDTAAIKSRKFAINTWTPSRGWVKGIFYLGTPTNFDSEGVAGNNEGAVSNFELHWIEVGDMTTHLAALSDIEGAIGDLT